MKGTELLAQNPRITVRRQGAPDLVGGVAYWMQRTQRALDNPALDMAIAAGSALHKPILALVGLVPFYPNANLYHYEFLVQGSLAIARRLPKTGTVFVLRCSPLVKFCEEVPPSLVIGVENAQRDPESWRREASKELRVPYCTVDADFIVPTNLLEKKQHTARTIQPRIRRQIYSGSSPNLLDRSSSIGICWGDYPSTEVFSRSRPFGVTPMGRCASLLSLWGSDLRNMQGKEIGPRRTAQAIFHLPYTSGIPGRTLRGWQ